MNEKKCNRRKAAACWRVKRTHPFSAVVQLQSCRFRLVWTSSQAPIPSRSASPRSTRAPLGVRRTSFCGSGRTSWWCPTSTAPSPSRTWWGRSFRWLARIGRRAVSPSCIRTSASKSVCLGSLSLFLQNWVCFLVCCPSAQCVWTNCAGRSSLA